MVIRRNHEKLSPELEQAWEATFLYRQNLCNRKKGKGLEQFKEFPCLSTNFAPHLILKDFNRKYIDNAGDILSTWPRLRNCFENFISTKNILGEEADHLISLLHILLGEQKDAVILMLLPNAVKTSDSKGITNRVKRRKLETLDEKNTKLVEREVFIVHVENSSDFDKKIKDKVSFMTSTNDSYTVWPFPTVVGPIDAPISVHAVLGDIRFESKCLVEALELCLKITVTYNLSYPKLAYNVWMLLQKTFLRLTTRYDKLTTTVNKAISFIEKGLDTTIS